MAPKTPTLATHRCECSRWLIASTDDQNSELQEIETTNCATLTRKQFAPGHDAKLKALLVRSYEMDKQILRRGVDALTTYPDPIEASAGFGFRHQVRRAMVRIDAERSRKASRTKIFQQVS